MRLTTRLIVILCLFIVITKSGKAQLSSDDTNTNFKVFPNPSVENSETFISLQESESEKLLVIVYDMLGRELFSKVEIIKNGGYLFSIYNQENPLPKGVYLIIASAEDKHYSEKLIVK